MNSESPPPPNGLRDKLQNLVDGKALRTQVLAAIILVPIIWVGTWIIGLLPGVGPIIERVLSARIEASIFLLYFGVALLSLFLVLKAIFTIRSNALSRETLASPSPRTPTGQSSLPSAGSGDKLDPGMEEALHCICGLKEVFARDVAAALGLTIQKAQYYLDELEFMDFVVGHHNAWTDPAYTLSAGGRRYLVKHGRL